MSRCGFCDGGLWLLRQENFGEELVCPTCGVLFDCESLRIVGRVGRKGGIEG